MTNENWSKYLDYWQELRQRLIFWLASLVILTFAFLPFANQLFTLFTKPLVKILPTQSHLIAVNIISGFWIPIEFCLFAAIGLSMPLLFFQLWRFVSPALKKHEKYWAWRFLWPSIFLFYLGIFIAYQCILPFILHFLIHAAPSNMIVLPDIVSYFNFALKLLLAFGLICQIPLIVNLTVSMGWLEKNQLKKIRPYVIIAAFVIGLIIAPDALSQTLIALPIWLLFELGLLTATKKSAGKLHD